ncbi:hypothetical protein [Indioceanicola profundi]|uniref:hypothetical protein n=1 Tax=Indioceanicola profundi TaxID=2220096 RepID=UPI0013C42F77|nr:hypothetical protein [Indioceanicola profundi]
MHSSSRRTLAALLLPLTLSACVTTMEGGGGSDVVWGAPGPGHAYPGRSPHGYGGPGWGPPPWAFNGLCEDTRYETSRGGGADTGTDEYDCLLFGNGLKLGNLGKEQQGFARNGVCDDPAYAYTTGLGRPGRDQYDCTRLGRGLKSFYRPHELPPPIVVGQPSPPSKPPYAGRPPRSDHGGRHDRRAAEERQREQERREQAEARRAADAERAARDMEEQAERQRQMQEQARRAADAREEAARAAEAQRAAERAAADARAREAAEQRRKASANPPRNTSPKNEDFGRILPQ